MRGFVSPQVGRERRLVFSAALALGMLLGLIGAVGTDAAPRAIQDPNATPSWILSFAGASTGDDMASDVKIAADGAVFVAGQLASAIGGYDASLVKIVDGAPVWPGPATYDGPHHGDDTADRLALGPGGVAYTAGWSVTAGGTSDVLLIKWSKNGRVLWARRYDGPGHADDRAVAVGVDAAGNVTVAAESAGRAGAYDYAVISWTAAGKRRWVWRYDGAHRGHDKPSDMVVAPGGGVYVTGTSQTGDTVTAAVTARLSSAGKRLWLRSYRDPAGRETTACALAARPGGGVYVAGHVDVGGSATDGLVVRYTASGVRTVFTRDTGAGGASSQGFSDVAVGSGGQVVAVGFDGNRPRQAIYRTDGSIAAALTWPTAGGSDRFNAVATDAFGGYYVTGTAEIALGDRKIFSGRGSLLAGGGAWASLWGPPVPSFANDSTAIAVRGTTCVVVGGCDNGPATGMDQFVLGYVY